MTSFSSSVSGAFTAALERVRAVMVQNVPLSGEGVKGIFRIRTRSLMVAPQGAGEVLLEGSLAERAGVRTIEKCRHEWRHGTQECVRHMVPSTLLEPVATVGYPPA